MNRRDNKYLKIYRETNKNKSMAMYFAIINRMFDYFEMKDPTLEEINH